MKKRMNKFLLMKFKDETKKEKKTREKKNFSKLQNLFSSRPLLLPKLITSSSFVCFKQYKALLEW
jgi:hypothetical protein